MQAEAAEYKISPTYNAEENMLLQPALYLSKLHVILQSLFLSVNIISILFTG